MGNTAVGCDIEETGRFRNKSAAFYDKIFTSAEITYCRLKPNPEQHFAVRYCAKEAVVKALAALGVKGLFYKDIEVVKDGATPRINIGGFDIKVSLSHTKTYAFAMVLACKV